MIVNINKCRSFLSRKSTVLPYDIRVCFNSITISVKGSAIDGFSVVVNVGRDSTQFLDSVIIYIASIQMSLKLMILLILKSMFLTLTFTLKSQKQNSTPNAITTLFQ